MDATTITTITAAGKNNSKVTPDLQDPSVTTTTTTTTDQINDRTPIDEESPEEEPDICSPLARLMYEFFTVPKSSQVAYFWAVSTCWIAIMRVLELSLETVDGPNYYGGRKDMSKFKFLLSNEQYWILYIAIMIPLVLDAVGRLLLLFLITWQAENIALFDTFTADRLEMYMFCCDILGVVPFLLRAVYFQRAHYDFSQAELVLMVLVELLVTGRILRIIKDIPAIRAIRITLLRSAPHLVVPIFFFLTFNITAGAYFYFIEPCYNNSVCPWTDLFQATFFSIVTMATVGYGNQVPSYEDGRFVACFVMVFGALFLSMPLAIIGNEYDHAWSEVVAEREEAERLVKEKEKRVLSILSESTAQLQQQQQLQVGVSAGGSTSSGATTTAAAAASGPVVVVSSSSSSSSSESEEADKARRGMEADKAKVVGDPVVAIHKTIRENIVSLRSATCCDANADATADVHDDVRLMSQRKKKKVVFVGPMLLLHYCELCGNLQFLLNSLRSEFSFLVKHHLQQLQSDLLLAPTNGAAAAAAGGTSNTTTTGGSRRRMSLFSHGKASADKREPKQSSRETTTGLNAIDEEEDDDDEEEGVPVKNKIDHRAADFSGHRNSIGRGTVADSSTKDEGTATATATTTTGRRMSADLRASIAERLLSRAQSARKTATRISLYAKMIKLVKSVDDVERKRGRTGSEEFFEQMNRHTEEPDSLRTRIWVLLEFPNSSIEARSIQIILLILIIWSVFMLYTQTVTSLTLYGESTTICQGVVQLYCSDKFNQTMDEGCFVSGSEQQMLQFNCDGPQCFGYGGNFGASGSNSTCSNAVHPPFQSASQLTYTYGTPYLLTSRDQMNRINPICNRIECTDNSNTYSDGQPIWIATEFLTNIIFTIEIAMRIFVSISVREYVSDIMNIFDILSVAPFFSVLFNTLIHKSFASLNFSILSSSPQPIVLITMRSFKIFRMFKLTRHFTASKVLFETAHKMWKQILGMISLLCFLVVLFAILLYQVEAGQACYVGDAQCEVPAGSVVQEGQRVLIGKNGQLSKFGNVFYGLWFSFVTLTTTGYGDIVPVTNAGQMMTIVLMLMGIFYMAMPLTASATTFYKVHEEYQDKYKSLETTATAAAAASSKKKAAGSSSSSKVCPDNSSPTLSGGDPDDAKQVTGQQVTAESPKMMVMMMVMPGDKLERRLKKRMELFLNELYLTHAAMCDLFKDLHAKSSQFDDEKDDGDDDEDNEYGSSSSRVMVRINGAHVPVLRSLRSSSSSTEASSPLLQRVLMLVDKADALLTGSEDDIVRVVVLHHKLSKSF